MTIPIGRYANHGPAIPADGMPDGPPLRILRIEELRERNGLNEVVILVDAMSHDAPPGTIPASVPIKLIVGVNPFNGEATRAAVLFRPGTGFIAIQPECLPGNLVDICRTIVLDCREII
jgi:hypothetical protein